MNVKDFDLLLCVLRVLVLIASFWIMIEKGQLPFRVYYLLHQGKAILCLLLNYSPLRKSVKGDEKNGSVLYLCNLCFFLFLNKKPYSDFRKQFMNVELFLGIIVSLGCDFLFFQPSGLFNAYSLSQFLLSLPEGNLQISSMPSAGLAWKIFHSTVRDFTWTLTAGQSGSIARITANETQVRAFWWSGSRMGYMHTIPWHL